MILKVLSKRAATKINLAVSGLKVHYSSINSDGSHEIHPASVSALCHIAGARDGF